MDEDTGMHTVIAFIQGKGDTDMASSYQYLDRQIEPGKDYYYRLQQVDFNGTKEYSKIIEITALENINRSILVFPNPIVNDQLTINFGFLKEGEELLVTLLDFQGRIIERTTTSEATMITDVSRMPYGVYLLRVEFGDGLFYTKKIVKL